MEADFGGVGSERKGLRCASTSDDRLSTSNSSMPSRSKTPLLVTGLAGFQFGGGVDRAPWLDPPYQRGSIDGTPKILPRLTPGPRS